MNIPPIGVGNAQTNAPVSDFNPARNTAANQPASVQSGKVSQTELPRGTSPSTDDSRPGSFAETRDAAENIERFVANTGSDLQFTVDEDTNIPVVKVIDRESQEVIRQMPSEEAIAISKALDRLEGLLLKSSA